MTAVVTNGLLSAVTAASLMLAGCGSGPESATPQPATTMPAYKAPTGGDTLTPTTLEAASNAEAFEKGMTLLERFELRALGLAEPGHGSPSAILSGTFGDHQVFMFVAPPGVAAPEGEVVGTREIGGVAVTTVKVPGRAPLVRFIHGGFTIDLQVFNGEGLEELALEVTNALVDGMLCPSECGDLPDGADG